MLARFYSCYSSPSYTLVLYWLWWVAVVMLMMPFWLSLINDSYACPAPPSGLPCTSLCLASTLPALHLPGAWLAPCCSWSCLSNHVALALAIGLIWWGEFPPDAQLMSRENLCWLWCAGAGAMCWCWCYVLVLVCCGVLVSWHLLGMHLVTSCLPAWWLGRPDWFKQIFWRESCW
jgi:hypothetical protein